MARSMAIIHQTEKTLPLQHQRLEAAAILGVAEQVFTGRTQYRSRVETACLRILGERIGQVAATGIPAPGP